MARSRLTVGVGVRAIAAAVAVLAAVLAPASPAAAKPTPNPDGPAAPLASAAPKRPGSPGVDLATYPANRWIVQLRDAPLSAKATGAARLDTTTAANVAYRDQLRAYQSDFSRRLGQVAAGARIDRSYQVVLNGLAIQMTAAQAQAVRQLPEVLAVTPDIPIQLDMYATPAQIGAPTLWNQVGGQSHAGDGIKVAIIDSGIYVTKDAQGHYAGNPCFNDVGYQAPPGFPKGDTRFTNNKVIVAKAYFRPGDPPTPGNDTPIQGPDGSPHGTHTAGTVACDAGTQASTGGVTVALSGIAPRAYLMNYKVFYPTVGTDDFQNGNAYVAELVQAMDDAVNDGADVISASWGSSYQNTLAWPDPMVMAAEHAVDAGVVGVFANGNAGPDPATGNSPSNSPKVIGVGAVTKNATIVSGTIDVTAPSPVPAALVGLPVNNAQFGPSAVTTVGPAVYLPAEAASGGSSLGCSAFPAGSLTGKIALIQRGTCEFSTKVLNAQVAGAVAAIVYNSAAGGDNLQAMGPGAVAGQVTIPSWFMRRSQGLAMRNFALAHPAQAAARFTYAPQVAANIGDVMAGFSSRGPTTDKTIKPDVVAPGVDVLSSGYGTGDFPAPFTGFGSASGTSMATPHVAGSAALLIQLHPDWTPSQVKSALMTTATEKVYLDTALTQPAGVLDRGAGRIDLTKAGNPGLTLDQPSLSGGEVAAGQAVPFSIHATATAAHGTSVWSVSSTGAGLTITPSTRTLSVTPHRPATLSVQVSTPTGTVPGEYEGDLLLTNRATNQQLHVPVWLGIRAAPTKDVLLVNDDGSCCGFADYGATYTALLDNLGVSYDYLDFAQSSFPSYLDLYNYRAVVIFTGDNDSFNTSGFFLADQDALSEWLDSGGRLLVTGQNNAEVSDSNINFSSPSQGRSRLYHGYQGLRYDSGSIYTGQPPSPTATGAGLMAGLQLDLGPTGDGAHNQTSIEASDPFPNNDTFQAANLMSPLFQSIGGNGPAGSAIAFSRGSEPRLEEERLMFRYRTISMGFGLEGINGRATRTAVAQRSLAWLLDRQTVDIAVTRVRYGPVTLTATASSSSGATATSYRWDFGDGSPIVTTSTGTVNHFYFALRSASVRVEVIDSLGHHTVGHLTVDRMQQ
jgi:minor extracellular serine protease Vpr